MNEVKTCGNEFCSAAISGRQVYCSDRCRKAVSRTDNSDKPKSDTETGQIESIVFPTEKGPVEISLVASLEDYESNPDRYTTRAFPEKLNWGQPLTFHELQASSFKANRVPIPGDWDYVGVAV